MMEDYLKALIVLIPIFLLLILLTKWCTCCCSRTQPVFITGQRHAIRFIEDGKEITVSAALTDTP